MRSVKVTSVLVCVMVLLLAAAPVLAQDRDLGRETLPPNDGWAAEGAGTTGGAAAAPDHVYIVTNRSELVAALDSQSADPKIIYVSGTIDANVDDNNVPLTCEDYYRDGYSLEAFLAAYDPAVWGMEEAPYGPLEDARLVSRNVQQARVRIRVGSNTTIAGLGNDAVIQGAWLDLRGTATAPRSNIIIRNITFQDTFDCFPAWSPADGANGSWNAEYDPIAVRYTHHVWIDHNIFEDADTIDSTEPTYFGVHYERHDGLTDITNASDFVTVSWNQYRNHDKVMLIGSSDSGTTAQRDRGRLNVTIHHNLFLNLGQRTPRVRFGKVHVYNNYYNIDHSPAYVYSWGVGIESEIYAENNYFKSGDITPDRFIGVYKGTMIHATGTHANGRSLNRMVDVVAAYNAAFDPELATEVGWTPALHTGIDPTHRVTGLVMSGSGPFNW